MNCKEARELFDLHVDGALEAAISRSFEDHLQRCSSCQAAYDAVKAESGLLRQAFQADLSSAAAMARIEARVRAEIRPAATFWAGLGEWVLPILGILLGLLVLAWGRFDGAGVVETICQSLTPRGGWPVAISSLLVAALAILAVMMIQPLLFGRTRKA